MQKGKGTMESKRHTMQKQIVYEAVNLLKNHPSAEDVYKYIHPKYPQISLSTVYRNLYSLVQDGKIKRLNTLTPERFDHFIDDHIHFKCNECGRLFDLDIKLLQTVLEQIQSVEFEHKIFSVNIISNGVCKDCKDLIIKT